jgi:hypothetical protein|tara:strand:+ start:2369 stop:2608 length:240 start_codon:yes stop_codon:yes gene_type:complete
LALKTFNIDAEIYGEFSKHCKEHGISMSKKVEKFIAEELGQIKLSPKRKQGDGFENKVAEERQEREIELSDDHPLSKYC